MTNNTFWDRLLRTADVHIGGTRPHDVQVFNEEIYNKILRSGRLAIGEGFVERDWDSQDLKSTFVKILSSDIEDTLKSWSTVYLALKAHFLNLQTKKRAFAVGESHYDLSNEFYEVMLGQHMQYTCDIWSSPQSTLVEAQETKLHTICQKLNLQPGQKLLDIGCGWGGLMRFAAQHYGVSCIGLSVSKEQTNWANNYFKDYPCKIKVCDYRDFRPDTTFDAIASIEMIEHVGPKNYGTYFEKIYSWLKPNGLFLLQAIGAPEKYPMADPWIDKYIFPNGVLPSLHQIEQASHDNFRIENLDDIGRHYERTLDAWWENLQSGYPKLVKKDPSLFTEKLLRIFQYYLQSSSAMIKVGKIYDWQILFSKR